MLALGAVGGGGGGGGGPGEVAGGALVVPEALYCSTVTPCRNLRLGGGK